MRMSNFEHIRLPTIKGKKIKMFNQPSCEGQQPENFRLYSLLLIMLTGLLSTSLCVAQNRAPSLYLNYQEGVNGRLIMNSVQPAAPSPLYTYHAVMGWFGVSGDGGGYCGIQEHPAGRNFIFSLWDPATTMMPITEVYVGHGTTTEPFGGEGTGLKSQNFNLPWSTGQWYTTLSRAWDYNGDTYFGFWVHDQTLGRWYHLVTMAYPVANLNYGNNTYSFIEDWLGNGASVRRANYKNGWKRKLDDSWEPFDQAEFDRVFPDAGTVNYIENYDGGQENDYYYMISGGTTTPSMAEPFPLVLNFPTTTPTLTTGEIALLTATQAAGTLTVSWTVNTAKSPQFSYKIEVFDNATFTGTALSTHMDNVPHARSVDIPVGPGDPLRYIRLTIVDVFDQTSAPATTAATVSCTDDLIIDSDTIFDHYSAAVSISTQGAVSAGNATFSAPTVNLGADFSVPVSSTFEVDNTGCGVVVVEDGSCAAPFTLSCGTTFSGNTNNGMNNWTGYPGGANYGAAENIHTLVIPNGETRTLTLTNTNNPAVDFDLFVSQACDNNPITSGEVPGDESVMVTNNTGASQTYHLVVDGWNSEAGTYDLSCN